MSYKTVTISNRQPQEWYFLQKEFYRTLAGCDVMTINYSSEDIWRGLATKPKWLYKAIKAGAIPEKRIILADSWDLVFASTPKEVIGRFLSFGTDIVISAEKNCFPSDHKEEFDKLESQTPYKYLNSGFIVGETEAILTCLEAMDLENVKDDYRMENGQNYHSNDQTMWQSIFLQQPVSISSDRSQELSQTLHDANIDEFDFSEPRIRNIITNSYPCAFHFNGGSKDNLELREPILKHLNLI